MDKENMYPKGSHGDHKGRKVRKPTPETEAFIKLQKEYVEYMGLDPDRDRKEKD